MRTGEAVYAEAADENLRELREDLSGGKIELKTIEVTT